MLSSLPGTNPEGRACPAVNIRIIKNFESSASRQGSDAHCRGANPVHWWRRAAGPSVRDVPGAHPAGCGIGMAAAGYQLWELAKVGNSKAQVGPLTGKFPACLWRARHDQRVVDRRPQHESTRSSAQGWRSISRSPRKPSSMVGPVPVTNSMLTMFIIMGLLLIGGARHRAQRQGGAWSLAKPL